jgi:hypothetical protein
VKPWISNDRKGFNQFNGVTAVALTEFIILIDILSFGARFGLRYPSSLLFPILLASALLIFNYWWIVVSKNGEKYRDSMRLRSKTYNMSIKAASACLVAISFVGLIFVKPN